MTPVLFEAKLAAEPLAQRLLNALRHALGWVFPVPHHHERREKSEPDKKRPRRRRGEVSQKTRATHGKNPEQGYCGFYVFDLHC
jgi:hypothetical protein